MNIQEKSFYNNSAVSNYVQVGSLGRPLLLLHGGNGRWQSFESILPTFSAQWRVYALDLRGHGKSSWVTGHYRLQDYVDDVIAFMRHHFDEPACLFGHSLGGIVALMVAAQFPAGVHALAVGDSPLSSQSWYAHLEHSLDRVAAWRDVSGGRLPMDELVDFLKDSPIEVDGQSDPVPMRTVMGEENPVFEWLAANLYQSDPDLLTAIIDRSEETVLGFERGAVLPLIQCPVLLLQGDPAAGGLMTDAEVEHAMVELAQPAHVRLDGVGHALHHVHPEPVTAALMAFFELH